MKQKAIDLLRELFDEDSYQARRKLEFISNAENQKMALSLLSDNEDIVSWDGIQREVVMKDSDFRDGVYYIYCAGHAERYEGQAPEEGEPVAYVGVVMGCRRVAVALHDIPVDKNGTLPLLADTSKCPETSEHYSWDREKGEVRFNAMSDFDGIGNTERLKSYGMDVLLQDGEYIPALGELCIIMMNLPIVNEALLKAGGDILIGRHWSSTEYGSSYAWTVSFGDGNTYSSNKYNSNALRAVAAF